jgi:hypothetical protein
MSDVKLTPLGLRGGVWRAHLSRLAEVDVTLGGRPVPEVRFEEDDGGGAVILVQVPADALEDGVQTFIVTEKASGVCLGSFALLCGAAAEPDLRAELDLLRAELDMLKRAFRRQVSGG